VSSLDMYDGYSARMAVVAAWSNPGPQPETHRKLKQSVIRDWPILARAIERLSRESEANWDQ
jgi:hypothetical protein